MRQARACAALMVPTLCRLRISAKLPGPGVYQLGLEKGPPMELSADSWQTG